ncbi:MAG: glycine--tRNA ligase subunit beta [Alphaproteobacteria bacterium]|nr:glycine--tRNA ligase subunit beta [Alphaproteobacteria bacterium]
MSELLLELFSEEIPARMQARAAEDLKRLATERLTASGLTFTRADVFVTPRRLALVVDGLLARTPDLKEEKKGPRVGSPDQAIQGFLKGAGLASLDGCEKRMVGKAEFWFAIVEKKGQATADLLPGLIADTVKAFGWPKSMRWGANRFAWVRPLQSVLALLDGKILAGGVDLGGATLAFGDTTHGHRFLAPARFAVTNFADYQAKLLAAKVMLDPAQRRAKILADLEAKAKALGLTLRDDPGLLDEVTGLVEWPVVLTGAIDAKFMDVPQEALITSMRAHQKYFALLNADGSLARQFALVANMETTDAGATIVAGNERVLRARLSDAKFFWDLDRKTKLADRLPALAQRVFHAKLGTMAQKVERLEKLSAFIATKLGADAEAALRAAKLAKADLSSGMVGEFPELQGIMGRYYARHDGEPADIADAIRAHYQPLGPSDACPSAPVSVAVALAEKLDTLAGFWSIDEKPTGSKDPFALRRSALGVIRLIVENKLRLALVEVFVLALLLVVSTNQPDMGPDVDANDLLLFKAKRLGLDKKAIDLMGFFADRLKVVLKEKGVRHDLIDAVFALGGEDDLVRLLARVDALDTFLKGQDGANLLIGYRRAANIVAIETKKDGAAPTGAADPALFAQAEENALFARLGEVGTKLDAALKAEDFAAAMASLAALRGPVDAFFDKVTVNTEDRALRANRLKLLSAIGAAPARVADFSKIEG